MQNPKVLVSKIVAHHTTNSPVNSGGSVANDAMQTA